MKWDFFLDDHSKHNKCRIFEKNQKSYRKEQKRNDEIKMTFQWKFDVIFSIFDNQEKTEKLHTMNWLIDLFIRRFGIEYTGPMRVYLLVFI